MTAAVASRRALIAGVALLLSVVPFAVLVNLYKAIAPARERGDRPPPRPNRS
jgi:hypothetical protein